MKIIKNEYFMASKALMIKRFTSLGVDPGHPYSR
jgi:hypothetical protein